MSKGRPLSVLPFTLKIVNFSIKLAMGSFLAYFFLSYQPILNFSPIKPGIVHAEAAVQSQSVQASSFPFVFQLPHPGYLSTPFSSYHPGIDIATGLGMPIRPIAAGTVIDTGFTFFGLGLIVEVDHGQGYHSLYAHMGKAYVTKGQKVTTNDILGEVGLTGNTTGPHTHLELIKDGTMIDPVPYLPTIRRIPSPQDFIVQGSATSSAKTTKTYTGGRTKYPQIAPNQSPVPTPKPTPQPTILDQLVLSKLLTPAPTAKPLISL